VTTVPASIAIPNRKIQSLGTDTQYLYLKRKQNSLKIFILKIKFPNNKYFPERCILNNLNFMSNGYIQRRGTKFDELQPCQ
jgi:hypothetical protein